MKVKKNVLLKKRSGKKQFEKKEEYGKIINFHILFYDNFSFFSYFVVVGVAIVGYGVFDFCFLG